MFNRSFNQFRIHWPCSLPFNNLKWVQNHRLWVYSPQVFPNHPFSQQLPSSNPFALPDVTAFYSMLLWGNHGRFNFTAFIFTGGIFLHTRTPMFFALPNLDWYQRVFAYIASPWQVGKGQGGIPYPNQPKEEWGKPPIQWSSSVMG